MTDQPVFRFAPSPNGLLHLGHAYSALITAEWAEKMNARLLLRIEDIDRDRCKPELTDAMLNDLDWLGIRFEPEPLRQSTRFEAYRDAARRLDDMGYLYPCFCSRKQIRDAASAADPDGAPIYPGTCRHLTEREIATRREQGLAEQWRLDTNKAVDRVGVLTFTQAQPTPMDRPRIVYAKPERWGDAVLVRKDTPTSYHLSVVVDDAFQGITHVTRGTDMQAATDLHVLLQFLLGLPQPVYSFHRLILDDDGQKLSKSIASMSLASLRDRGWTPHDVRNAVGL